ncbi:MAG: thrombospondin type 3 repeat-containing protein [Gammaproteobacteria bacterium]|nr:thrombospondin type 3 repeat-containing protein [Gammaproteobacteria bacterium]
MKKYILVIPLFLLSYCVQAATISWSSTSQTVNENATFSLDIVGLSFATNVDGGGVNVSFDPNVINVVSVSIDETVWNFGPTGIDTGTINNVSGSVSGILVNTLGSVTGNFTVATVTFQIVGSAGASTDLTLSELIINPWASNGAAINPGYINGIVTITSVAITDTDGDGIDDTSDNCPAIANATQTDTDNDGVGDVCDNDDDNDSLTDVQEVTLGTNPLLADTDGDGFDDNTDNCPLLTNDTQTDTDNDGVGDVCDNDTVSSTDGGGSASLLLLSSLLLIIGHGRRRIKHPFLQLDNSD